MPFTSIAEFEATESPTTAERALIAAVRAGEDCILNHGTRPTAASDATQIRADLLRLLILGGTPGCGLHESGVWLEGGYITGTLNLSFTKARGQCVLNACIFVETPVLTQAKLPLLSLEGSQLPGLFALGLKITGSLLLSNLTATGTVDVNGAQIGGQLACNGAKFSGVGGNALNAHGAATGQGLILRNITATGTVDVNGAQIGGQLVCDGATLNGAGGKALIAQGVTTGADLFLRNVIAIGTVDVNGARIGGQLACDGATLNGVGGDALHAQGVTTGASLFLSNITSTGMVNVSGAQIGAQMAVDGATLNGVGGKALNAQSVTTGASLILVNLTATGTVDVAGAQIAAQLTCRGATLDGAGGKALNAQGVTTGASLILVNFTATGTVDVAGAQIRGQLNFIGAKLGGAGEPALVARSIHVSDSFIWRQINSCSGRVNLNAAHVATLVDDAESWAKVDSLNLDGFTYDRITASPTDAETRLEWLRKGSVAAGQFSPQPYTQFAKVLREMGHASEARKVLMERESRLFAAAHTANLAALNRARSSNDGDVGWAWIRYQLLLLWAWFTRRFSGYGHAPQYALFWSLGCIAFGAVWFFIAWQCGVMVPNSDVILTSAEWSNAMALNHDAPTAAWGGMNAATHYETFYSLPYALDVFVPLVSMGQETAWSASTVGRFGWATRWFTFAFQIAGWAITALGVASITGFVQKNQPD